MQTFMQFVSSSELGSWVIAITALVTAANGITMLTPTKSDDKVVGWVLRVLNFVSLNVLKNKNADAS